MRVSSVPEPFSEEKSVCWKASKLAGSGGAVDMCALEQFASSVPPCAPKFESKNDKNLSGEAVSA